MFKKISPKIPDYTYPEYSAAEKKEIYEALLKKADKNRRVSIKGVSDGTLLYEFNMIHLLVSAGCTDIKTGSRPAQQEEIPKDKPFLTWYMEVSGTLPEEFKEN